MHTGEVEPFGGDIRGVAVHEAARIAAAAAPGEILVSALTRQLAAGPEFSFDKRGERELKGLSGARQLFAVASPRDFQHQGPGLLRGLTRPFEVEPQSGVLK